MSAHDTCQASDVAPSGPANHAAVSMSVLVVVVAAISLAVWGYFLSLDGSDGYGTRHGWMGVAFKALMSLILSAIFSFVSIVVTAIGWKRVGLPVRVFGAIPGLILACLAVWILLEPYHPVIHEMLADFSR